MEVLLQAIDRFCGVYFLGKMIIKRNLKSQMPSLKRCRVGDSPGDNDENSASRKKKKLNAYYPLNLLGEVAAGIIPLSLHGIHASDPEKGFSASWSTEVSCSPGEVESKSKGSSGGRARNPTVEVSRPPLVRTSRGRVQVLPSRFNDSVIENWKKESKVSLCDYSLVDEFEHKRDRFVSRMPKSGNHSVKNRRNEEKMGYKYGRYATLCEEDEEDGYRSIDIRKYKYSSSRSTLTSVYEQNLVEEEKCPPEEIVELMENGERKAGLYGPEDFYSGDIVWGKSGKNDPFWPAIVVDPMTQAPELVLRSCIPDAACVMFFGHSGNSQQRVWITVESSFLFMQLVLFTRS